ncbi:1-deoxy-D-xylulose-5-phosphate synthase [Desulfocicer vacuolatum DSM 3385]|uniref:1-deoxy-D-xylulose-5-phosphate synthase n=1 Tax=Desulfocicer vacuolatum DSM 3385 TaxID=1121400 RepID=A0A1W2AII6_9BACT|nr:1-deoxy-D-xylulose-5-phosphate synthase [Desulfocicer vacuolatum]SMC60539.1 1-deoxy-D-xylulose-5-phosphate synthase [Desulfocicer vacuolatum DSM 3385]
MSLLQQIQNGDDLKAFSRDELPILANEIRERIISVVSKTGGHLASSLGAVELTLAIHYVFNLPVDSLIWDVGHQAYAHKLLTGRDKEFDTLRSYKGISGFTKISENPCDAFTVGHASTSISAGLGIASAKHLKQDRSKVISVIGDGSLTAGLAYEGLNQAGDSDRDLIVILNDNDMSISPNVGAISSFLSRKLSAHSLQSMRKEFGVFLKSLPGIGDDVYKLAKRSEDSFKTFVTPGMLFEAFNFDYFGPIDGHRLNHLIDILENIKKHDEPVLLHVITTKGKGYPPAEKNPVYYHGVGAFDVETGGSPPQKETPAPNNKIPSYTQVFGSTMMDIAAMDERVVAITAAMPEGTGLKGFSEKFPHRFFDVGIAEQHAVTFAGGMASRGMRPVVAIYSTFMQRAYDQILHDVCIDSHPVIFALDRGGIVGEDGPTHHGLFDYAFLRNIPNMTIMAPRDENELGIMLRTAVNHDGPIALRYPRGPGEGVDIIKDAPILDIGKGECIRDGRDILILAVGRVVQEAIKAADVLEQEGHSVAVINARFIKPLDRELILETAAKTQNIVTVEEHVLDGGFGSAVLELLADNDIFHCRVRRVGIQDTFVEHGPQKILRKEYKVDAAAVISAAKELLNHG